MSCVPYDDNNINGSPMVSARVYEAGVAVVKTVDGEEYVYSRWLKDGEEMQKMNSAHLSVLFQVNPAPIFISSDGLTLECIVSVGRKNDVMMFRLIDLFCAGINKLLSDSTREKAIEELNKALKEFQVDVETAVLLGGLTVSRKAVEEVDIQGGIAIAEKLGEKGVLALEAYRNTNR